MAITVNNSNSPKNMRLRINYTSGAGNVTFTKIESCRTDGYDTQDLGTCTVYIKVGSATQSFSKKGIYFNKNSSYTTITTTSYSFNASGSQTVTITFDSDNSNINGSKFTFTVDCGYKSPSMSITSSSSDLESVTLNCSYTNATPTQIQIYNNTTGAIAYSGTNLNPTISGLTPNTTYSFKVRGYANSVWGSYSSNLSVATLRQAYATNITPINNESSNIVFKAINPSGKTTKLTITGYNSSAASMTVLYDNVDISIPTTEQEFTYSLTSAHKEALNLVASNTNQIMLIITITTSGASTTYSTDSYSTYSIVNSNPTLGNITYTDTNTSTTAITNNNQQIIVDQSTVSITIPKMTTLNSATASYYNIIKDNTTILSFNDDGSTTYTKEVGIVGINSSLQVEAVDSRGSSVRKTVDLIKLAYSSPVVSSVTYSRENDVGERVTVKANGTYSRLDSTTNKNSIQNIQYRYREISTDGTYGSWSNYQNLSSFTDNLNGTWNVNNIAINGDTTQGYDSENSYQIELKAVDKLSSGSSSNSISTSKPTVWYDRKNKRVGIGKKPEVGLDVNGEVNADNIGDISNLETTDKTSLVDAINELKNSLYYKSGDSLTFTDMVEAGFLTTGKTQVIYSITMPKSMANVSVGVTDFVAQIRNNNNYILGTGSAKAAPSSLSVTKVSDYHLRITVNLASATTNAVNNDACGIAFNCTINFS